MNTKGGASPGFRRHLFRTCKRASVFLSLSWLYGIIMVTQCVVETTIRTGVMKHSPLRTDMLLERQIECAPGQLPSPCARHVVTEAHRTGLTQKPAGERLAQIRRIKDARLARRRKEAVRGTCPAEGVRASEIQQYKIRWFHHPPELLKREKCLCYALTLDDDGGCNTCTACTW